MDTHPFLTAKKRTAPGHPERHLLGPTGARLWMDYMEAAPGFIGRADFIRKCNIPLLFSVSANGSPCRMPCAETVWKAEESRLVCDTAAFHFEERKLISWDDTAISLQTWRNRSPEPMRLQLVLPCGCVPGVPCAFPGRPAEMGVRMTMCAPDFDRSGTLTLRPGETRTFLISAKLYLEGESPSMSPIPKVPADMHEWMDEKCAEYLRWFDPIPSFECDDGLMTRCWHYRFYLLRKNLCAPGGTQPFFCEGRDHRMAKEPYTASGWEFARMIPLSVPMQVRDARWIPGAKEAEGTLRALLQCADEEGVFSALSLSGPPKAYAHFCQRALYEWYLVTGKAETVRALLPAYKRDAAKVYRRCKADDSLQIERTHALTGKEYQPSFWFFTDRCFPKKVRPAQEGYTALKRVDRSVYAYLNFDALARLCDLCKDADGAYFASESAKIRSDILNLMWDPVSQCFYDLHALTNEKAFVKNIVCFDPMWAGLTGEKHLPAFRYLTDPCFFALGSAFASCAADCPAFSSDGGWFGDYFKGPHGCMWNGPSWPYATALALDALARQSKEHGHRFDADFDRFLGQYTLQHFGEGTDVFPCLVEFYDSRTGRPLSEEADYCHSFYIDLIVRHVAGVEPEENGIRFAPVRTHLKWFRMRGLDIRGHRVDAECREGLYTYTVDGEKLPAGTTFFAY